MLLAAAFNDEATGKTFEMITLQGYAAPLDKFTAVFSRLLNDDQRKGAWLTTCIFPLPWPPNRGAPISAGGDDSHEARFHCCG